jgi:hypothetical protein
MNRLSSFSVLCLVVVLTSQPVATAADDIVDEWRYTLRRPADGWQAVEFNDTEWQQGSGGFGMADTPGARVGTIWATKGIWLRKTFELSKIPARPAFLIHHDEDARIFLNGQPVATFDGWTTEYKTVPLTREAQAALRPGRNLLAVHCRQTSGGQFIDVHVIDADHVPELPAPQRPVKPFVSELITRWGKEVTPDNAWTEYPRPQLKRSQWQNLNGHWDYAITDAKQTSKPVAWDGRILVPFCLESRLGGVQRLLDADESLWYRRTVTLEPAAGQRTLLNFEAVDYRCEVLVNGTSVGSHQGGNTPFSFDITEQIVAGDNELMVRVEDDTEGYQLRGKQTLNPRGIWYTQVSGIWQTVWLEQVPAAYVGAVTIGTDANEGKITIRPTIVDPPAGAQMRVTVLDGQQPVTQRTGAIDSLTLKVDQPALWSPASPHLYDLQIELLDSDGNVVDSVESYAGIRTVGRIRDSNGHWRMTLNGEPIFHWGPLDQGWWPDGLLTPPSDAGMLYDIEYLKAAGFNMIRKHIKVEPRRYYYHCDRLGMMVWQDQVSAGNNPPWTRLKPDPQDAVWPDEHHQQYMIELNRMIDTLVSDFGWHSLNRLCCEATRSWRKSRSCSANVVSQNSRCLARSRFRQASCACRHTPTMWKCHPPPGVRYRSARVVRLYFNCITPLSLTQA